MSWGGGLARGFYPPIDDGCSTHPSSDSKSVVTNGVSNGMTNGGHARAAPANLVLPRPPAGAVSGSNPAHYTFYRSEGRGYKADNGPRAHSLPSRIGNGAGSGEVRKPPRGASSAGKPPVKLAPLPKLANWTVDDRKGHRAPHPPSSLTGTHPNTHAGITTKDHENHLSRQQKFASAWAQARAENHVESPVSTARGSESSSPRRAEHEAAEQRKARAANISDRTPRSKSEPAPADRSVQVRPSRPPVPEPRSTGPSKSPDKAKSTSPSRVPAYQDGRKEEEVKVVDRKSPPGRATARRAKSSIKFSERVVVLGETGKDRSPSTDRRTHQPAPSPRTEGPPVEEERVVPPYHPAITDPHVIYRTYTGRTKRELQLQRIEQQEADAERARRAEVGSQYSRRSVSRMAMQDRKRKRAVLREGEARLYLSARSVYKGDGFRLQRKSRFLQRLEEIQKEMRKCQTEEEKQRLKLWNDSRQRQKSQLLGVRKRFQKEQVQRFRTQYVTSRVLEHEHANRHHYGLPEDFNDSGVDDDDDDDDDDDYDDDDDSEGSGGRVRRGKSSKSGGRRTRTRRRVPTEADTARTRRRNERLFDAMFNSNRGPAWDRSGTPKMEGIDFVTINYTDDSGRNVRRKREASDFVKDAEEVLNGDEDDLRLSREPTPSPFTSPRSWKKPRAQTSRTQSPAPTHRRGSTSTQRTAGRRRRPSETSKPPRYERPPWNMRPDPKQDPIARKPEPRPPKPKSDFSSSSSNKTAVTQGDSSPANSKPPVTSSTAQHRSGAASKSHGDSRSPAGKSEHNTSEKPAQQTDNSALTKGDRGGRSSSKYPAKSQPEPKNVNSSKDDEHLKESDRKGHQKPDDTPKQDSVSSKRSVPASSGEKPDNAADKKEPKGAGESKETTLPPKTSSAKDTTDPGKPNGPKAAHSKGPSDSSEDKNTGKVSKEPEKPTVKPEGASQRERTEAKPVVAHKQTDNLPNAKESQAAKPVDSNKQTENPPHARERQAMKPVVTNKQAEVSPATTERQAAKPVDTNKQAEISPATRERQAAKPVSDSAVKPKPNSTRAGVDASKQESKPRDSQTTAHASKQAQDLPYARQTPSRGAQAREERRVGPRYVARPKSRNLQSRPRVNSDRTSKTNKPEPPVRDSKGAKNDQEKATKAKAADQNRPDRRRRVSDRTASKQSERPGARRGGEGGKRQTKAQEEEAPKPKASEVKKPALDISNRSKRKAPAPAAAPLYFDDSDDDDDDDDVDIFERARLKYGLVIESDDDDDDLFDKSRR